MGNILVIMGKSAVGKDTAYSELVADKDLDLKPVVIYTTRPMRDNEKDRVNYNFVSIEKYEELKTAGLVIEDRHYKTVYGVWIYFTVKDEQFNTDKDIILINTLDGYKDIVDYFGQDRVIPIYLETDDNVRIERALKREKSQEKPKYSEMCRRFIADNEDFSEDKLNKLGIVKRYDSTDLEKSLTEIKKDIRIHA